MIVISGASGFVGRRLAVQVANERPGVDLRCLVKAEDDEFGRSGIAMLEARSLSPIAAELRTGSGLEGLHEPEVVLHLAANTHTWERDQSCNDTGTRHLFRAVEPLSPAQHFIFVSTEAVMDNRVTLDEPLRVDSSANGENGADGDPDSSGSSREASPSFGPPLSRYGLTKLRAEEFLRARCHEQHFRLSIVRLCTVYGSQPRPNSFFDVLKREVARRSVVSRLNWPGLTSFIHVDDVVSCLLKTAKNPPDPGRPRVCLLAAESQTLQQVSEMLYCAQRIPYRAIRLPSAAWRLLKSSHAVCRMTHGFVPVGWYNQLWRFNLVVNSVFNCDTRDLRELFPELTPLKMAECIGEI